MSKVLVWKSSVWKTWIRLSFDFFGDTFELGCYKFNFLVDCHHYFSSFFLKSSSREFFEIPLIRFKSSWMVLKSDLNIDSISVSFLWWSLTRSYSFMKLNFYVECKSSCFFPTFFPRTCWRKLFDSVWSFDVGFNWSIEESFWSSSLLKAWFYISILFISSCFLSYSYSYIFFSLLSCIAL